MSLKILPFPPVPEETARVVHACFPHGTLAVQVRDALGPLSNDEDFADLFPTRGQPAEAPWRLALVTVLPFLEGLPDRQAADAVRSRLAWKYALSLELSDPGCDHTVLSEFRTRLVAGGVEERVLDRVVELARARGWLKTRGTQRTDSTHVLAAARALTRLECVGETLRHVLKVLAEVAPAWLQPRAQPEWVERYAQRVEEYGLPKSKAEREPYAHEVVGADGWRLLDARDDAATPPGLRDLPAVQTVRRVWSEQYHARTTRASRGRPPARAVARPGGPDGDGGRGLGRQRQTQNPAPDQRTTRAQRTARQGHRAASGERTRSWRRPASGRTPPTPRMRAAASSGR